MFLSDYGYMGPEFAWMQIVGNVITKESIIIGIPFSVNDKINNA